MRRIISGLLAILLLVFVSVPVNAFYNNSAAMSCVIELVETATKNYSSNVNVKDCRLSTTELTLYFWDASAGREFRDIIDGFTYKYSGSYVETLTLNFRFDRTSTAKLFTKFEDEADKLIASLDEKMTTLDKIFYLHNYLVLNTVYDSEAAEYQESSLSSTVNSKYALSFSTLGPLVNGKAVCSGYSQNYLYLLNKIGVESKYLTSNEMNHGWNIVKYNGNWYHVDVTYDDPVPDLLGFVDYKYFMRNDEEMRLDHKWDDRAITMTSKSLTSSNYIFNQKISDAYYYDGFWYYVKDKQIMRSLIDGSDVSIISDVNNVVDIYMVDGTIYYTTSVNGVFLNAVYETNYLNEYNIEITTLENGIYTSGLYYDDGVLLLTSRDGSVDSIEIPMNTTLINDLVHFEVKKDSFVGTINSYWEYYAENYELRNIPEIMFDGEENDFFFELNKDEANVYSFSIPFTELKDDIYKLKFVYRDAIYDFLETYDDSSKYEEEGKLLISYQSNQLTISGLDDYEKPTFDYSPYGNGLFPIYENSRVYYMKQYANSSLRIAGYAFEPYVNSNTPNTILRELVIVNMESGEDYRVSLVPLYSTFLNANKNLNPEGKLNYAYACYDTVIDFTKVYTYKDKKLVSLPKGTYRLFIRISDGKRSNVISLQNLKREEVIMPNNFFLLEDSNDVGMYYGS